MLRLASAKMLVLSGLFVVASFLRTETATASSTSPTSSATPSPRIISKAKEWFHRFQDGNIDRTQLDERTNRTLTDDAIRREAATLKKYGTPTSFEFVKKGKVEYATGYYFVLTFMKQDRISAKIIEAIAFDTNGKIAGLDFDIFVPND
jgi:hypothetical protein